MNISLKKQILQNNVKHQIHERMHITSKNGKTEYHVRTHAKNEVVFEQCWISDYFELREPEFYKLVTIIAQDDDSRNIFYCTRCMMQ